MRLKKKYKSARSIQAKFLIVSYLLLNAVAFSAIPLINYYFDSREEMGAMIEVKSIIYDVYLLDADDESTTTELTNRRNYSRSFAFKLDYADNVIYLSNCLPYKAYISNNLGKFKDVFLYKDETLYISHETINNVDYYAGFNNINEKNANTSIKNKLYIYIFTIDAALMVAFFALSIFFVRPLKTAVIKQNNFIGNVSHELKTPLSIIKANTELLDLSKNYNSSYTQNILEETNYMSECIKELLDLTEFNNTKHYETYENVSLLITNTCLSYQAIAYENKINYNFNIEPDLYSKINIKDFKRLLVSLLSNSFSYVNEEKKIFLNVIKNDHYIDILIYNTGCDIEKKDAKNLFEKFFKGNQNSEGHGLGLSMVKSICEKYNYKLAYDMEYKKYFAINIKVKIKKDTKSKGKNIESD